MSELSADRDGGDGLLRGQVSSMSSRASMQVKRPRTRYTHISYHDYRLA